MPKWIGFANPNHGIVRLAPNSPGGSEMFRLVKGKQTMQNLNNHGIFVH